MKFKLQSLIIVQLVGLLTFTVTALSITSFLFSQSSAKELQERVLLDTSRDVYGEIRRVVDSARTHQAYESRRIQMEKPTPAEFPRLARSWIRALKTKPELAFIGLALDSGETFSVARPAGQPPYVREWRLDPKTKRLVLKVYDVDQYPGTPRMVSEDPAITDVEHRPWVQAARHAEPGEQVWTPCYGFIGEPGTPGLPGTACVSSIYGKDGERIGVLGVGVDVLTLCEYLESMKVGKHGFAFVAELKQGVPSAVIGHPSPERVWRPLGHGPRAQDRENIPLAEIDDPRVRALVHRLPPQIQTAGDTHFMPLDFKVDHVAYVGGYEYLRGPESPDWIVCTAMPERDIMANVWRNNWIMLGIGALILFVATCAGIILSRQIARPLAEVIAETRAIARFDCEPRPVIDSPVREVVTLGKALEEMKTGLRSFRKYVPADLVRSLMMSKHTAVLGGVSRNLTIFFCDIVNFTTIAEELSPFDLVEHLREYLGAMSNEVTATQGTVDKYIGDAIMAFWGAPLLDTQHALHACMTALRCQTVLKALQEKWKMQDRPLFAARFGLNTGEVVVGNIGSETRMNYTVIGDTVNVASRLEGMNKVYGTTIIISENTYREAAGEIVARPLDWMTMKGKSEPVLAYELLGLSESVDVGSQEIVQVYSEALARYREQKWDQAIELFTRVDQIRGGDPPSRLMIERCQGYRANPPGENWDGVHSWADK